MQPLAGLGGVQATNQHQSRLRRLRTIDDGPGSSQLARVSDDEHRSLAVVEEEGAKLVFSQQEPVRASADDVSLSSSSPTLPGWPNKEQTEDEELAQIISIQQQGLCEASRVWEDLTARVTAEGSRDGSETLSKLEHEFLRRWEGVVAATAQQMREVRLGRVAF
jgi:hypothetical protein